MCSVTMGWAALAMVAEATASEATVSEATASEAAAHAVPARAAASGADGERVEVMVEEELAMAATSEVEGCGAGDGERVKATGPAAGGETSASGMAAARVGAMD